MGSDPRARFVEAMRGIHWPCHYPGCELCKDMRTAVEAFADEACRWQCRGQDINTAAHDHATCRAALFKEVFGE